MPSNASDVRPSHTPWGRVTQRMSPLSPPPRSLRRRRRLHGCYATSVIRVLVNCDANDREAYVDYVARDQLVRRWRAF